MSDAIVQALREALARCWRCWYIEADLNGKKCDACQPALDLLEASTEGATP